MMIRLLMLLVCLGCATVAHAQQTNKPFAALQASATAGKTVKVTGGAGPASVSGTLTNTVARSASNIRIFNAGTITAFVRVSAETTPTATTADIPVAALTSIIVPNPVPTGATGLAVLPASATATDVYFTPGEGGQ